jgi:hypothetical protein
MSRTIAVGILTANISVPYHLAYFWQAEANALARRALSAAET